MIFSAANTSEIIVVVRRYMLQRMRNGSLLFRLSQNQKLALACKNGITGLSVEMTAASNVFCACFRVRVLHSITICRDSAAVSSPPIEWVNLNSASCVMSVRICVQ